MPNPHRRFDVPLSRRQLLGGLGAAGLAAASPLLGGCTFTKGEPNASLIRMGKEPAAGRKYNIEMYSLWGSTTGAGLVTCAEEFEKVQSDIGVRVTFAPTNGVTQQKLLTAIAGKEPRDCAQLIPYQTPQWAALDMMVDITDWLEEDGIALDQFFGPAAEAMTYQDRIYQLNWDADPNFPFFWNKDLFEKAGLDPEKPPETIDEVDEYCAKLLKKEGGQTVQIGLTPWSTYGYSNSIFTWGLAFGGQFREPGTDNVTPDNEYVVKALEWMVKSAELAGGPDAVSITPPSISLHPFGAGALGMSPLVAPNLKDIMAAKKDMKIGAAQLPYQGPGASKVGTGAWIGGWSMFVPKYAKYPRQGYEFIKWLSATQEGTKAQWENVGFPVSWKQAECLETMRADPVMGAYYDCLVSTVNARPPVLVADYYVQQLEDLVSRAVYKEMTPLAALTEARVRTEEETKRFLNQVKGS